MAPRQRMPRSSRDGVQGRPPIYRELRCRFEKAGPAERVTPRSLGISQGRSGLLDFRGIFRPMNLSSSLCLLTIT